MICIGRQPCKKPWLVHGRPCLPQASIDDGKKDEIAAIHPDFESGGKIPCRFQFHDLLLALIVNVDPGLEREQAVRPGRKPKTYQPPRARHKSRGGRATADPTTARSGGERGKPRDRDEPRQRAPRTVERQTQGGTTPRRDPTAGRTQRHRNHRNETDTARQTSHDTPPQSEPATEGSHPPHR